MPPVMYSQPLEPQPSTTATAPELRTAKRSPAWPAANSLPAVAPYSTVLPMMVFSLLRSVRRRRRAHDDRGAGQALADIIVGVAEHFELQALHGEGAERLAGRAAQPHRQVAGLQARSCRTGA